MLWLLEELGLPYDIKRYARDPQTAFAPPELRRLHPLGKSPLIDDGGIVIAEIGAIVEHLVERAGGALRLPAGSEAHRRWTYCLHFAEGSAMPLQVMAFLFNRIRSAPPPFDATPVEQVTVFAYRVFGGKASTSTRK